MKWGPGTELPNGVRVVRQKNRGAIMTCPQCGNKDENDLMIRAFDEPGTVQCWMCGCVFLPNTASSPTAPCTFDSEDACSTQARRLMPSR